MELSFFWSLFSLMYASNINAVHWRIVLSEPLCIGFWVASIFDLILSGRMLSSSLDKIGRMAIPLKFLASVLEPFFLKIGVNSPSFSEYGRSTTWKIQFSKAVNTGINSLEAHARC